MKTRKKQILIVCLVILLSLIVGISYAWLKKTVLGEKTITINSGTLSLLLNETSEGITISNASPVYDKEGKTGTAYTFALVNTGNVDTNYQIYLDNDEEKVKSCNNCKILEDKNIRYQIVKNGTESIGSLAETRQIDGGVIAPGEANKISYELRLWLNINAGNEAQGNVFYGKLRVEAMQNIFAYDPDNTNANAPELASNMVPVKYDGYNWIKAENNTTWYNYDKQVWANAVTVSSATRSRYTSASPGTVVNMNDIETMWVWIPRYSYTIASEDGTNYFGKRGIFLDTAPTQALPGEIDIKFISKETKDTGNAKYQAVDEPSNYRTPDGFTLGDKELSGVWVGKFETSNKEGQYESNTTTLTPIVKPNLPSWRNIQVSKLETVAMNMTAAGNSYGFSSSEVDSHAAKNSEWVLASYLSQSRFGKLGNRSYKGANKEVYMNNHQNFQTGCSSGIPMAEGSDNCAYNYDELTDKGDGSGSAGGGASTTGNIYGIYDMSGGAWEYVMGNYNNYSGYSSKSYTKEEAAALGRTDGQAVGILNSGYTGLTGFDNLTYQGDPFPDPKYYNLYTTGSASTACNGGECLSHALSETARWYNDDPWMLSAQSPWMLRGGSRGDSSNAGVFSFNNTNGAALYSSFRLILCPQ